MSDKRLFFTTVTLLERPFILAATERGLCYVDSSEKPLINLSEWMKRSMPTFNLIEDPQFVEPFKQQLEDYLTGDLSDFDVQFPFIVTEFKFNVCKPLMF